MQAVVLFTPISAPIVYPVINFAESIIRRTSITAIGRQKRDHAWIMSRSPEITAADYQDLVSFIEERGYEVDGLRRVPHTGTEVSG